MVKVGSEERLEALNAHLWTFDDAEGRGFHPNPATDETKIYTGSWNGVYYAFDQETGEVVWQNRKTGETTRKNIRFVFLMIGAMPNTDWLGGSGVKLDDKGFVCTGTDVLANNNWPLAERPPRMLETSVPGIFAAGDVRSGSVKRVTSAVGEGGMAINAVHRYLSELEHQTD